MPDVLHLTAADARRAPWKNGRGVTEELAVWPAGASLVAGDLVGRISRAVVEEDGPFSAFPGLERILVVTRGAGLLLEHGDAAPRARVRPLEPYRFSGDWPTTARLVAGPITDFNVLLRRGRARAEVLVLRLGERRAREELAAGQAFLHAATGALRARLSGEDEAFRLAEGESLWIRGTRGGEELDLAGGKGCVLLLVRLADG